MDLTISDHARTRYAERVMGKEWQSAISYLAVNKDKVDEFITKLVEYGTEIYSGEPIVEYNKQPVTIYLRDTWVVIVDKKRNKVITLYSIDLGLGKEFNDEYISLLMDKLDSAKKNAEVAIEQIERTVDEYKATIESNEGVINTYRGIVKSLTEQNDNLEALIAESNTNKLLAESEVRSIVATIIGKRVF